MYDEIQGQIEQVTAYLHLGEVTIDTPVFKLHYVARSVGNQSFITKFISKLHLD